MSTTFDKVNLIMLEGVTGYRVVERTEARTGRKAMSQRGRGRGGRLLGKS